MGQKVHTSLARKQETLWLSVQLPKGGQSSKAEFRTYWRPTSSDVESNEYAKKLDIKEPRLQKKKTSAPKNRPCNTKVLLTRLTSGDLMQIEPLKKPGILSTKLFSQVCQM